MGDTRGEAIAFFVASTCSCCVCTNTPIVQYLSEVPRFYLVRIIRYSYTIVPIACYIPVRSIVAMIVAGARYSLPLLHSYHSSVAAIN